MVSASSVMVGIIVAIALVFWGIWVSGVLFLWRQSKMGCPPSRSQVEARDWPAALALGFSAVALVAWFVS